MRTGTLKVASIRDEGDRIVIYGPEEKYHVIAAPGTTVQLNDTVEYEPCGWNFGWFIKNNSMVISNATSDG